MTVAQTLTHPKETKTEAKNEIIFPQGEFWSDEPPLESYQHLEQIIILLTSLQWLWRDKDDYFCAGNLTIYYSPNQKKSEDFRGPDFFVVLGTTNDQTRKSWVVWEEDGKYPNVIVEILSDSTAKIDREDKKKIYQDTFKTPDYFWFDPVSLEFQGFTLFNGLYQPIKPNDQDWLYSQQLGLYLGIHEEKLRYFTTEGELVPTPEESAFKEKQQKELALQEKEYERQQKDLALQQKEYERQQKDLALQQKELALGKVEELTERLRELGINPDEIS